MFYFLERSKSQPDELAPKSPDYLTVPDAGQHRHSRSKSFPLEALVSTASMRSVVIHSSPRDGGSTREEHRTDIPPRIEMYVLYHLSTNKCQLLCREPWFEQTFVFLDRNFACAHELFCKFFFGFLF